MKGKRVNPEEANIFQVLVRVPQSLLGSLQHLSGGGGAYIELRLTEGRGADTNTATVWLQNGTLAEAQHKLRITDQAIAVARFSTKYGIIRVPARHAEAVHAQLNPETGIGDGRHAHCNQVDQILKTLQDR